jgi:hypothetical protein
MRYVAVTIGTVSALGTYDCIFAEYTNRNRLTFTAVHTVVTAVAPVYARFFGTEVTAVTDRAVYGFFVAVGTLPAVGAENLAPFFAFDTFGKTLTGTKTAVAFFAPTFLTDTVFTLFADVTL